MHLKDSADGDAYLNAGILYLELEDFEQAEAEFAVLTKLQPTNPLGPFYLGLIHEQRADFQEALGYYNQASSLSPREARFAEAVERMKIELQN